MKVAELSDSIEIRRMNLDDLDDIIQIEKECFTMPWTRGMFVTEISDLKYSHPFLARWKGEYITEDGKVLQNPVCGYTVFWKIIDEIHIGNLAIAPLFRRKGLASYFLNYIINLARDWKVIQITLEVRASNQGAINLYESFGFKKIAIRKLYYNKPDEDAIVMLKDNI